MLRHLAQRLVIPLTVIVVVVAAFSGLYTTAGEERQLLRMMSEGADQLSRSITSATWHAMLADRRQDAYQVMGTIAQKEGIDRIRMFNRNGVLTFSTKPEEIRHQSDRSLDSCSGCHVTSLPLQQMDLAWRTQIFRKPDGRRSLDMLTPIYNEPSCSQSDCHAHPASAKVLGLLEVQLSLAGVDSELATMRMRVLVRAVVEFVLIIIFILIFTRRFVSRPLQRLAEGAQAISQMDLDRPIQAADGSVEIERLAGAFEVMRVKLKSSRDEILQFTQTLESKVADRSRQLQAAQQKLQNSDRLASLGQLAASVAHEINNPISGVLNLSMLMQRILKEDGIPAARVQEFRKYLNQVTHETTRVGRIVSDLLSFSRRGKPQRTGADLNRLIRSTVSLVDHKLKLANMALELKLASGLPHVLCDAGQIQQVVLNLVLNAAEAMQAHGSGTVRVETAPGEDGKSVVLSVSDAGEGIPPEILPRIFDPFFTTKSDGKGVGLGLAVSYGIVQAHGGEIEVRSRPGEGTVFTVTLPLQSAESKQKAEPLTA
ncbi:MAG: ATP-binding protein [Bryobacteraceae bacterium]|jgi:two-component system NtrC family sensor kinase